MITIKNVYLDYSATTPVVDDVLNYYVSITKKYIGNPNSAHFLGSFSKSYLKECQNNIAKILGRSKKEIIFTSCASESNSTIFRSLPFMYPNKKHIIISPLEHKSVIDEANRLIKEGYIIKYVKVKKDGLVDLDDLKRLLNEDTVLVSICGVNSETGFVQDLKSIKEVIDSYNSEILFHSDLTQALGKIKIDLSILDFASFSSHKIYAPKGLGILYKSNRAKLDNLISGTTSNTPYRGGTPAIPLIGAFNYALTKINNNIDSNYEYVKKLNNKLTNELKKIGVVINSNKNSIPHILNISLINMESIYFIQKMSLYGISISSKSACSALNESLILNAITNKDKSISKTSIRISLSYLTKEEDIDYFIDKFKIVYNNRKE